MILLNASAVTKFSYLAVPPTHAQIASRSLTYATGTAAISILTLNYWYGTVNATGTFIVNTFTPTHVFQIPYPDSGISAAIVTLVLNNIFGAGIAPNPADPTTSIVVVGKKAGDHKIFDIDVVAAFLDPALAGTVV